MRTRPYVWEMVKEAIHDLSGEATYSEIRRHIRDKYGDVNNSTITCQIIMCTVNHRSRVHYPQCGKPRRANGRYDFLFRTGRGRVEMYDPERHGLWEIRSTGDGGMQVAPVGDDSLPTAHRATEARTSLVAPPSVDDMIVRIPSEDTFIRGVREYERREKRDSMYKVATFVVSHFWGTSSDMADGLGVLLLTWNQAFYRYGTFDFDRLERCIAGNLGVLEAFRAREISSFSEADEVEVTRLFGDFWEALRIESEGGQVKRSAVAVAKALHLLAPGFFPLWDDKIAREYGCRYGTDPAEKYVDFCWITKAIARVVSSYVENPHRTVVKLIDQYNYSRFTRKWI